MAALDVEVYRSGLFCCSVCAPAEMSADEVVCRVNAIHPCGTEHGWMLSENTHFKCGEVENGGIVDCHRGHTRHWLLDA